LKVRCQLGRNLYPAGVKVPPPELQTVNPGRHDFQGGRNYTTSPKVLALER
jgi:hypothetical protein